MTTTAPPVVASDPSALEVRQTPDISTPIADQIAAKLASLPEKSMTAVLEVPRKGEYVLAWYVNVGNGWSFGTWGKVVDGSDPSGGVTVSKVWGVK